jgi:CBS domain-containing protein
MTVKDCGEIPVVEDTVSRLPIGVVTDRDIVCRTIANDLNPLNLTAADCMSKPIVTVTPDMSLEECCRIMEIVAGHIVREVSEPTLTASAASV